MSAAFNRGINLELNKKGPIFFGGTDFFSSRNKKIPETRSKEKQQLETKNFKGGFDVKRKAT